MTSLPPGMTARNPLSGPRRWIPSSQSSPAANKLWSRSSPAVPLLDPEKRSDWSSYLVDTTLAPDVHYDSTMITRLTQPQEIGELAVSVAHFFVIREDLLESPLNVRE